MTLRLGAALLALAACGSKAQDDTKALPPAEDWNHGPKVSQQPAQPPTAPVKPPVTRAVAMHDRFLACFGRELARNPINEANALEIIARMAPKAEATALLRELGEAVTALPEGARAKVYGEDAWALADAGDVDGAREMAKRAIALPADTAGGRITALAVLGRIGDIATARANGGGTALALDVVAFGAALGGHADEARKLRKDVEAAGHAPPAIHAKLLAALGDLAALKPVLADRTSGTFLVDAGAIIEGGSRAHQEDVVLAGIAAVDSDEVAPAARLQALLAAAGNAGAHGLPTAAHDALARAAKLDEATRRGTELVPVAVLVNLGELEAARKVYAAAPKDALDASMFEAGLAAASRQWNEVPARVPPNAVLLADIWGRALSDPALADDDRLKVLVRICP